MLQRKYDIEFVWGTNVKVLVTRGEGVGGCDRAMGMVLFGVWCWCLVSVQCKA